MFGLGVAEILVILVLVLVLFGAGKLPQVMADLGKGLKSFKDEMDGTKVAVSEGSDMTPTLKPKAKTKPKAMAKAKSKTKAKRKA